MLLKTASIPVAVTLNSFPLRPGKVGFRFANQFSSSLLVRFLRKDNRRIEVLGKHLTKRPNSYRVTALGKTATEAKWYTRDKLHPTESWAAREWGTVEADTSTAKCFGGRAQTLATDTDAWLKVGMKVQILEDDGTKLGEITACPQGESPPVKYRNDDWDERLKTIHKDGDFTDVMPIVAVRALLTLCA